jgi:hypothetical protein
MFSQFQIKSEKHAVSKNYMLILPFAKKVLDVSSIEKPGTVSTNQNQNNFNHNHTCPTKFNVRPVKI